MTRCPQTLPSPDRQTGLRDRAYADSERDAQGALIAIDRQIQKRTLSQTAPASAGELRLLENQRRAVESQRAINEIMRPLPYP